MRSRTKFSNLLRLSCRPRTFYDSIFSCRPEFCCTGPVLPSSYNTPLHVRQNTGSCLLDGQKRKYEIRENEENEKNWNAWKQKIIELVKLAFRVKSNNLWWKNLAIFNDRMKVFYSWLTGIHIQGHRSLQVENVFFQGSHAHNCVTKK